MNQVKTFIKKLSHGISDDACFGLSILPLTTRMFPLMEMISSRVANTYLRLIVIYEIRSILYHVKSCLVL